MYILLDTNLEDQDAWVNISGLNDVCRLSLLNADGVLT